MGVRAQSLPYNPPTFRIDSIANALNLLFCAVRGHGALWARPNIKETAKFLIH